MPIQHQGEITNVIAKSNLEWNIRRRSKWDSKWNSESAPGGEGAEEGGRRRRRGVAVAVAVRVVLADVVAVAVGARVEVARVLFVVQLTKPKKEKPTTRSASESLTGFYWVLICSVGFYWALLGFYWA